MICLDRVSRYAVALVATVLLVLVQFVTAPGAIADDYTKSFLARSDFSNRDMTDSGFAHANLRESNLAGANLKGVTFFGANLESVDLTGANLTNSTLDSARLTQANLTNAILEGAFVFNAKFNGSTIDGADFTDVQLRLDQQTMLCNVAKGTNPITNRETRETLMCDEWGCCVFSLLSFSLAIAPTFSGKLKTFTVPCLS
jgi:hypothetical protein